MSSKLYTATLLGLDCKIVEVEVDYRKGNSYFSVVGLADKSIQEARDRIPAAIKNSGSEFIPMKIIMNLAPAELPKSGPSFDLPLAIGYLLASDQVEFDPKDKLFIGELALNGRLRPISGILPIIDSVKKLGFKEVFLPLDNASEAAIVPDINIFGAESLSQVIEHLNGISLMNPFEPKVITVFERRNSFDLADVKGQNKARRALEIAATGLHNILMSGTPGSGKTMLSKCVPGILPQMNLDESIEVTRIYSVAGLTSKEDPLVRIRPFRSPHHTSSQVSLVGGGGKIKPGEISLAHRGVLFLDEFPEFGSKALEALRQPLEDKVVTISRASGSLTFPASFMLVAAMNPCKCGYYGDEDKKCICTNLEIVNYQKKISGPILDRIDLLIHVNKVKNEELFKESKSESSTEVLSRVENGRVIQQERFKELPIFSNSEMNQEEIKRFVQIDQNGSALLQKAVQAMNLSARSYYRILKVARTIADLAGSEEVKEEHLVEALSFRISITEGN